ncbi:PREDICTED: uncharacterized protein LOC106127101 [Papilio xuthus]|uniref:Uncharacterized protein LOC106127101 n=3 Tax=Papilio xuthus TaxID=66420 RepID=A0AAJ6ZWG4_PAPXU|nr:PREDICTED: uncharacterized protein LOC106127101 [Papilio xuthus]
MMVKVLNHSDMFRYFKIFLFALIVLSVTDSVRARKFSSSRHSYPKSGGLSGGGGHHYPSSGGLSGNSRGYPSSGGSHGYPSSGGSHGYPSSGGSHGYPSSGGSHGYPSSGGSHGYPASGGLSGSGSHGYPANKGLSGSNTGHTTNVHYHYNYNPPQRISYAPAHGGPPVSYPVYRGAPPTYVYQYKDSGSKYGTLLAGLALLNLGTLAGGLYANRHSNYKPQPGEICKFGIRKANGDYEETKIDCKLITSFIFEEEAKKPSGVQNSTVTTTTVTNTTVVNTTNLAEAPPQPPVAFPLYTMLPNGTLVPVNGTMFNVTSMNNITNANDSAPVGNANASTVTSVTTTTTNTTVTNALDVKGKPVDVTPNMKCYVIRNSPSSNMRRSVPCGLLQTYADQSIKKNSASNHLPSVTILSVVFAICVLY